MSTPPDRGRDEDRSERVRELFAGALDLTAGERAEYLRSTCAGDADLHELVADLLRHRAEQERPRRIVALKVLSSSMLLAEARQRFAKEAELLSRLSHPGIAQVYGAGVYGGEHGGIACFAMELVPGRNLTTFVREQQLDVNARLHLLIRICDAVQHAHGRGVVHRDLKPANILIDESTDGQCQPKVLDFGIARSTDLDHVATQLTRTGQVLGPIVAVDWRADGRALAVLLANGIVEVRDATRGYQAAVR